MFGKDENYKILTALQSQIHDLIEQNIKLQELNAADRKAWDVERKTLLDRILAYQNAPLAVKLKQMDKPDTAPVIKPDVRPRFPGFSYPNAPYADMTAKPE